MSEYQAIYDAVRSRIGNCDIGGAIRDVAWQTLDFSHARELLQEQIGIVGMEMSRPAVLYRPAISIDGDKWCALYGDDLQSGCAGFGDSIAEAMADFDKNWLAKLSDRSAP